MRHVPLFPIHLVLSFFSAAVSKNSLSSLCIYSIYSIHFVVTKQVFKKMLSHIKLSENKKKKPKKTQMKTKAMYYDTEK